MGIPRFAIGSFVAVACTLAAVLLRLALAPWLEGDSHFFLFTVVVFAAAWSGGWRAGVLATGLNVLAGAYFQDTPGTFVPETPAAWLRVGFFMLEGVLVSGLFESLHRSRMRLAAERAELRHVMDERRAAERVTLESQSRLDIATAAAGMGVFAWDPIADVVEWDARMYELFGRDPAAGPINGAEFFESVAEPTHAGAFEAALKSALASGERFHTACPIRRSSDRALRWLEWSGRFERDVDGQVVRLVAVVADITDRRDAEATLRANAERLRLAIAATGLGIWDIEGDLPNTLATWSEQAKAIFGLPLDEPASQAKIAARIHPDDRPRVGASIRATHRAGMGGSMEETFRVVDDDGAMRWVQMSGRVIRATGEGGPRIAGVLRDVTERHTMEERVRASEERFRLAADAVDGIIYEADEETGHVWRSAGLFKLLGFTPEEVEPTFAWWRSRWHPDDVPRLEREAPQLSQPGRYQTEYRVRHRDGHYVHVWDQGVIVQRADGKMVRRLGSIVNVTARVQAEQALRDADRRKDDFLATLAHELRNPLAPLRTGLQVLQLSGSSDPVSIEAWAMMDRQLGAMVRLIDDLLDVSRITRGKLRLRRERVLLADVLRVAVETSRPNLAAGLELDVHSPDEAIPLDADPTRLAQVFANLLNNAAKFTDAPGRIDIAVQRAAGQVIVTVRDTGIGIAAEALPRLFQMFSQADSALDRTHGGLGIGLSLVKGLVELHGGSVSATSDGVGQGSTFTVTLPVATTAALPTPVAPNAAPGANHLRILVVDDNRDAALSLGQLLTMQGHDVRTAFDGAEGVEVATAFRPDVVVMDIGMPRMNGYEAAQRLRAAPTGAALLLIAVTGWGQQDDKRRAHEAGFDYHLTKPINPMAIGPLLLKKAEVTG